MPPWLRVGGPIAVVVAILVTVALCGGFRHRTDRLTAVPVGSTVDAGEFTYSITAAYAERDTLDGTDPAKAKDWLVTVYGTVQLNGDTGDDLTQFDDPVSLVLPPSSKVVALDTYAIGTLADQTVVNGKVTPGLPPVPVQFHYKVPIATTLPKIARVVVWNWSYYDNSLTQNGQKSWNLTGTGSQYAVPLVVVD